MRAQRSVIVVDVVVAEVAVVVVLVVLVVRSNTFGSSCGSGGADSYWGQMMLMVDSSLAMVLVVAATAV